ncbi:hypothetical protein [Listeria monocytogenes]|uniref:hypothetical protein n=1 Tax=Listeria monocytogenes TaxID=1639 RepID=UPI0011EB8333|nr:hypothetical protein [Listeria monocytogenes]TYU99903.1 hypothetical protein FZ054_16015 [Listeria monocytogenes]
MKITWYIPPYNKQAFYNLMSPFFAEKIWRYQFPYLVNTPEKKWCVLIDNDKTIGFSSYMVVKKGIEIGEIYGLTEDAWKKIASSTLKKIAKDEASFHLFTDVKKVDTYQLQFFRDKGFEIYRETKNFAFLKRNDEWKKKLYENSSPIV